MSTRENLNRISPSIRNQCVEMRIIVCFWHLLIKACFLHFLGKTTTVDRHKFNHLATKLTTFAAFPRPLFCMWNIAEQNRNLVQGEIELPALNFSNIFCGLDFIKLQSQVILAKKCFFQPISKLNEI